MSISIPFDKIPLNKVKYSVRASQAIVQYSVGSMVDFPDQTLMPSAPEQWENSVVRIHDERLQKLLHVEYFGMPGSKDLKQFSQGISYVRFPEWYLCPKCRRIQPMKDWIKDYRRLSGKFAERDPYMLRHMNCPKCRVNLVVARIITVCPDGHISDFPWVEWAHARSNKPICAEPHMRLFTSSTAAEGLEGIIVHCETCGARASLTGAFSPTALKDLDITTAGQYRLHCHGHHPWKNEREACGQYPKVIQRGSSSAYFPVVESSLVIPPFSSKETVAIENCEQYKELLTGIDSTLSTLNSLGILTDEMEMKVKEDKISEKVTAIAASTLVSEETVKKILERKLLSQNEETEENDGEETTLSLKYKIQEYEALGSETTSVTQDGDFRKEIVDISEYNIPFVKSISLIHKIREVEAIIGFTRIKPASREEGAKNEPKIVSIKEPNTKWYPAYEIRGEGIFVEFDSEKISNWLAATPAIRERAKHIDEAYRVSTQSDTKKTAKYIVLHTLSHILIKQLSFECGYGIASLKERIYCSEKTDGKEMSAIFIYTANGDSEGTLGGLVRQGRSDCFPGIFRKALESAMICSNDPVCSMSKGQGRDSINLAACYSCSLIPETSCERGNLCLDRGMLIGIFADHNIGLYSPYVYGQKKWKEVIPTAATRISPNEKSFAKQEAKYGAEEAVEDNEKRVPEQKDNTIKLRLVKNGTGLKEVDYKMIWKQFVGYAESETEKSIYQYFAEESKLFAGLEKPWLNAEFETVETGEKICADLTWKTAKVLFFSEYGDEDYQMAKDSDWKCVSIRDGKSAVESILRALKKEGK